MPKNFTDQIEVYHKGDKEKGIEGTGQTRLMGLTQFNLWGKHNGWVKKPATGASNENTGTSNDSVDNSGADATGSIDYNQMNAKDLITQIKVLGEAGDKETIQKIRDDEEAREDSRSTVLTACDKYLND